MSREKEREYGRAHYRRNKQKYFDKAAKAKLKRKAWFLETYKDILVCKCGESDIRCLDFHHLDPKTKVKMVSELIRTSGKKKIAEEIAKCEVLCANCHRKIHATKVLIDTRGTSNSE